MEQIIRNVKDIETPDRQALEHLLGQQLRENQQVTINVVNIDRDLTQPDEGHANGSAAPQEVPSWWKVYEGLSDDEIDRLDASVRQRANLTRIFE